MNSPRSPYPHEFDEISQFLQKIFFDSISPLYDELGIQTFLEYIHPDVLKERNKETDRYTQFLLEISEGILGFMEVRDRFHISLLFIRKDYQRKGWGKKLISQVESLASLHDHSFITLNASPNSRDAYLSMGFVLQSDLQMVNGVKFYEMRK